MINVGVIGTGTVAQLMHLPTLSNLPDLFKITAVCDLSPSLTRYISNRYHARGFSSPLDLVSDADVDAVFVLSPDQYHAEYAKAAILAGKHVFIEKPVTLCPQELEELIDLEKQHPGQICMVGYMRRYDHGFLQCKGMLDSDNRKIEYLRFRDIILEGDYYIDQTLHPFIPNDITEQQKAESIERRQRQIRLALGENCTEQQQTSYQMLTGLGCHSLSSVRELVGKPREIRSVAADGEHLVIVFQYDGFLAVYELVNDQNIVQFDAAIEIYQHDRYMHIKYETPYLRYQPHHFTVVESSKQDTKTTTFGPDYRDTFENELKYFHECIKKGLKPMTSLEDSMNDLLLFKQICEMI